ncbi:MAG: HD domain-containing phosphohydrolase [Pyrinomonadaceae bacterium]
MHSPYKILCVDDEGANLRLLERLFRDSYEVFTATGSSEALEVLELHDIAVIISDQRMPGMTGIDFLKRAAEMRRQTVRIMLTGYTDAGTLVEAINSSVVYKYVTKPWINEDLAATVKRALQHYETMKGQRQLQLQNERLQSSLKSTRDAFIEVLMQRLEAKDPAARGHAERVRDLAAAIGETMGLDLPDTEKLALAGYLHETPLGGLANERADKHHDFSDRDYRFIESCFEGGLELFERVRDLDEVASVLRFQFEHFDGSGQPRGFSHEQIPLNARILSVSNAFDSLTTQRGGGATMSTAEALQAIASKVGRHFDPDVVKALCRLKLGNPERTEEIFELDMDLVAA